MDQGREKSNKIGYARLKRALAACVVSLGIAMSSASAGDDRALRLAAKQLASAQLDSGLFDFDFDFTTGAGRGAGATKTQKMGFIVRQAVGAYGLAKYFHHTGDETVRAATMRAIEALAARSIPVGSGDLQRWIEASGLYGIPWGRRTLVRFLDSMGLLYRSDGPGRLLAFDGDYETAWVGGTALALLAELHYAMASGDQRFAVQRRSWLAGLMALHVDGAGFREYPGSIDESPLAHGEIWLALSFLPSDDAAALGSALQRIDRYLLSSNAADPTLQFFHWGMMAVAQRGAALDPQKSTRLAERISRHVLDSVPASLVAEENTCTIVEGLAATAQVLRREPQWDLALLKQIDDRIAVEMAKNLSLQILPGQSDVLSVDGTLLQIPPTLNAAGAFVAWRIRPYIRVDYTGHCLSALIELARKESRR